jgi:hypothetical protein
VGDDRPGDIAEQRCHAPRSTWSASIASIQT